MFVNKFYFIQKILIIVIVNFLFLPIAINTPIFAQETDLVEQEKLFGINVSTLLVGILGAFSAILAGVVTSYLNNKGNLELQIRNDLRNKRIDIYSQIFFI
jgi:hypothetical protein